MLKPFTKKAAPVEIDVIVIDDTDCFHVNAMRVASEPEISGPATRDYAVNH